MLLLLESRATSSSAPPVGNTVQVTHTQLRMWGQGMGVLLFVTNLMRGIFGY
jgi:hypothetical protein